MPMTNWFGNKCGNCGHKSASALPKYTCQQCNLTGCPECMGDKGVDEDGNIYIGKKCCAIKRMDEKMKRYGVQQ